MTERLPIFLGRLADTPLGPLWVAVSETGLVAVEWEANTSGLDAYLTRRLRRPVILHETHTAAWRQELDEYLHGRRKAFSLPIDWGTLRPFQRAVLQHVYSIPYGETRSYGDIARQLDRPQAVRAVGRAVASNPMPLVIPCHRVIGADGTLHGYSGGQGLSTKEWLLRLEGALVA